MSTAHRADYIFDHGTWIGKCRICDYSASDVIRRRAADQFRFHIREMLEVEAASAIDPVIDLEELAGVSPARSASDLA